MSALTQNNAAKAARANSPIGSHSIEKVHGLARIAIGMFLVGCVHVESRAAQRSTSDEGAIVRTSVRDDGLVATYFRPKGDSMRRGVMVVGGSEGGIRGAEWLAFQFAERGFATLAVAYFGMEGLPEKFADIPLEYFDRAISWLGRQSFVEPGGIALLGSSRGAELVLLVASHNVAVDRVVAYAPSHVVWGPAAAGDGPTVSSWTRGGRSLPFVPSAREADLSVSPYRGTPAFLAALQQTAFVEAASIPVEQIRGAVLLLSGEDDLLWPSTFMANAIVARLKKHRHRFVFEHHAFAKAGHVIAPGFDPAVTEFQHPSGILFALGGTSEANREAQDQALKWVLAFLHEDHGPSTRE